MVLSWKLFVTTFLISTAKLEPMRITDEYADETEIIGIIYGAHCPVYVCKGNEHNEGFICCAKYGDDTFPDAEPIRLLYTPETDSSPGHYDLLVTQHDIKTCSSDIDLSFENTGVIVRQIENTAAVT